MRVDDLSFEYDEELLSYVSGVDDIDIVIQPLKHGFDAEVIDGTVVHKLGEFVSERWAQVSALEKAKELLKVREVSSSTGTEGGVDLDEGNPLAWTPEEKEGAWLVALKLMGVLPAFWRSAKPKDPSGRGD